MRIDAIAGLLVRTADKYGSGEWQASRGTRKHNGVDFVFWPGTPFVAPTFGRVVREARPYADDDHLSGLIFQPLEPSSLQPPPGEIEIKILYVKPDMSLIGKIVKLGHRIGTVQDVGTRYPGITPHVHFEITKGSVKVDPMAFFKGEVA